MPAIAGKDADIYLGEPMDTYAHSWTLDIVLDPLETTNWDNWDEGCGGVPGEGDELEKPWRTYIGGLMGWTGTVELYMNATPSGDCYPLPTGTIIEHAKFYVDKATEMGYCGDVLVVGVHPNASIEGIESWTLDIQGTGRLAAGHIGSCLSPCPTATPCE